MKLSRLYSNEPGRFRSLLFNKGLNLILAEVKDPKDLDRDSHNLGKSLFGELLDFMLLKEVGATFFTRKHKEHFEAFIFFLEIELPSGDFLTIRRGCEADTKISLKKHEEVEGDRPFVELEESEWDHFDIPIARAKKLVDGHLNFDVAPGWSYRKGVSYFLRSQKDYFDPFRLHKFNLGKDRDWKPYIADVLGLPGNLVAEKYEKEQEASQAEALVVALRQQGNNDEGDRDRVASLMEAKQAEVRRVSRSLDDFQFHDVETEISSDLAEQVEGGLVENETKAHFARQDLATTKAGLENPLEFKLEEVKEVFDECEANLPELLVRKYSDLERFSRKLVKERNRFLKQRERELVAEIEKLDLQHKELSDKRSEYLQVLRNKESLNRFKELQRHLVELQREQDDLKKEVERLESLGEAAAKYREAKRDAEAAADQLKKATSKETKTYEGIKNRFHEIVNECLSPAKAILFHKINGEGNITFHAEFETEQGSGSLTSQGEGHTYQKLLCVALDLAILAEYSRSSFFHFVYHDGAFEALENRKKRRLFDVIQRYCEEFGIQYLFSVIEHDWPRDESDERLPIPEENVALRLDDQGDSGRLFMMSEF